MYLLKRRHFILCWAIVCKALASDLIDQLEEEIGLLEDAPDLALWKYEEGQGLLSRIENFFPSSSHHQISSRR